MSQSTLDRVMGQAEAAAENFREPSTNVALRETGSEVANTGGARRPSLESQIDAGGISVDQYLQLKFEGFATSEIQGIFDNDILATIDMSEVVPIVQVRETRNGKTNFLKSYDGEVTVDNQNLQQAVNRLKNTPDTTVTGPYETSEIPFTVLEDIVVPGKSGGTIAAGTRIGTTPPITGTKAWAAFLKELRNHGLLNETVKVKLVHTPKTNTNGNKWGIVTFELIGVAEEAE